MTDAKIFETLTEREAGIKAEVDQYRERLWKDAREIIHDRLPSKVLYLNRIIQENKICPFTEPLLGGEVDAMIAQAVTADSEPSGSPQKKRKVNETMVVMEKDGPSPIGSGPFGHPRLSELVNILRSEVTELMEMCNTIKVWIQLNIPRIEDGNNFGVSIQEETVNELGRAEDSGLNVLDNLWKFHVSRAKLISKAMKYPTIEDYRIAVSHHDGKQLLTTRLLFIDLRNNYAILHDIIVKNLDKIRKPRSSHHSSLY